MRRKREGMSLVEFSTEEHTLLYRKIRLMERNKRRKKIGMLINRFELQGTLFNLEWEPIVDINHYHVGAVQDVVLQQGRKDEKR
ncbi:MAG TPA: hypothetical protein ENI34_06080 [candidate division WOR-3 bacterium]|uniref:Uncharacterized protein n=1 Tax=candidate division WOR-3 bacterium TaxID=2052148 RepID=A0A9C9EMJ8_UNCW3|nr:hypothetical protein [candidate division WOR-3 bacterium]